MSPHWPVVVVVVVDIAAEANVNVRTLLQLTDACRRFFSRTRFKRAVPSAIYNVYKYILDFKCSQSGAPLLDRFTLQSTQHQQHANNKRPQQARGVDSGTGTADCLPATHTSERTARDSRRVTAAGAIHHQPKYDKYLRESFAMRAFSSFGFFFFLRHWPVTTIRRLPPHITQAFPIIILPNGECQQRLEDR